MNDHDMLFRSTFGEARHAASLLQAVLPPALTGAVDWASLVRLPGSFVDPELRDHHTDLLFSVAVARQRVLVYVLLEHKSAVDRWTAFQLLQYVVRVHEAFRRDNERVAHLPPIVPIVVSHGPRAWRAPRSVHELIDLSPLPPAVQKVLSPLQPDLHFVLDDLARMPEEQMRGRGTTAEATLTLLVLQFLRQNRQADPVEVVERWLLLWRSIRGDPSSRDVLRSLLSYLVRQLETDRERFVQATIRIDENETMGKTLYEKAVEEGRVKGEAKGEAKGEVKGKAELLLRQLQRRFGHLPPELETRIKTAAIADLDLWADRILDARNLAGVFQ